MGENSSRLLLQKEKRESTKSDVPKVWRPVTANITNFPFHKINFHETNFYETIINFLCYKTNSPFYEIKLRIMILTFHILKLSGYHNINIYILIFISHNIKLNCYYKIKLLIITLTSEL